MIEALINTQYESIRGFNYQPSYDFSGLTIWREFRQDVVAVELERGKKYFPGMNTIRAWLSWDAFLENPKRFAANFDALLEIAAGNGLRVIPTLFNGWHSIPNFGGIVVGQLLLLKNVDYWDIFLRYISELVGGHANDERICGYEAPGIMMLPV